MSFVKGLIEYYKPGWHKICSMGKADFRNYNNLMWQISAERRYLISIQPVYEKHPK